MSSAFQHATSGYSRPTAGRARLIAMVAVVLMTASCAAPLASRTVTLRTQNDSGVTGTVTLVAVSTDRTRVEVRVDPAGHRDMPAHIHPGTCDDLTPQPAYPLENVRDGVSDTEIASSMAALGSGEQSLNLHHSNDNMKLFMGCVELHLAPSADTGELADGDGHQEHASASDGSD